MKLKINHFQANDPFLYHLKTSENQRFSHVFRGHKNETLARNGFEVSILIFQATLQMVRKYLEGDVCMIQAESM